MTSHSSDFAFSRPAVGERTFEPGELRDYPTERWAPPARKIKYPRFLEATPWLLAWSLLYQVYLYTSDDTKVSAIVYASYVITLGLLLGALATAWHSVFRVGPATRMAILSMAVFLVIYVCGALTARSIPDMDDLRRYFISTSAGAALIVLMLCIPMQATKLVHRIVNVIIFVGLLNAAAVISPWSGIDVDGRKSGIFDQSNISGAIIAVTGFLLAIRSAKVGFVEMAGVAGCSVAAIQTGSYSAMLIMVITWSVVIWASRGLRPALRIVTITVLLGGIAAVGLVQTDTLGDEVGAKSRLAGIQEAIATQSFDPILENSTFVVRLKALEAGIKDATESTLVGQGLDNRRVYVEYFRDRARESNVVPHVVFVKVWLTTGLLPAIAFLIYAGALMRLVWVRCAAKGRRVLGVAGIAMILVVSCSVPEPFDVILNMVSTALLCMSILIKPEQRTAPALVGRQPAAV